MTLGLRCYSPACHRHPASLLVRVPAAKSSLPVLSACALRPRPNLPLRLASSPPSSSFHPDSSQHLPSTRVRELAPAFQKRRRLEQHNCVRLHGGAAALHTNGERPCFRRRHLAYCVVRLHKIMRLRTLRTHFRCHQGRARAVAEAGPLFILHSAFFILHFP